MSLPYGLTPRFVLTNLAVGAIGGFTLGLLDGESLTFALLVAPMAAIGALGASTAYHRYERDRARAEEDDPHGSDTDSQQ